MGLGETWSTCWTAEGLNGTFGGLAIKDSQTMILTRRSEVPLRTKDGGKTWHPLTSCNSIATYAHGATYSWTGRTVVLVGSGGVQSPTHQHPAIVWVSRD